MKKGIVTVFIILGILLIGLILWAFVFNGGGLQTAFNAVADPINNAYQGMTGGDGVLIAGVDEASDAGMEINNNIGDANDEAW